VGGGNSAGEESVFLTRFSDDITIVTTGEDLTASSVVRMKVAENPALKVRSHTTVAAFRGDGKLSDVVLRNTVTGAEHAEPYDGVFVFNGLTPNSELATGAVDTDEMGFVLADAGMATSRPGVFVAGDVRAGSTKQAASAAGEGAAAAIAVRRYIESRASGLRPAGVAAG